MFQYALKTTSSLQRGFVKSDSEVKMTMRSVLWKQLRESKGCKKESTREFHDKCEHSGCCACALSIRHEAMSLPVSWRKSRPPKLATLQKQGNESSSAVTVDAGLFLDCRAFQAASQVYSSREELEAKRTCDRHLSLMCRENMNWTLRARHAEVALNVWHRPQQQRWRKWKARLEVVASATSSSLWISSATQTIALLLSIFMRRLAWLRAVVGCETSLHFVFEVQ